MLHQSSKRWIVSIIVVFALVTGYYLYRRFAGSSPRNGLVRQYLTAPQQHTDWTVHAGDRCPGAPFSLPTEGLIGYLWGDTFQAGHSHQGLDIFGGEKAGVTPVYAVADGYLTRLPGWKSSVIIRLPEDPLGSQNHIWTYYTHMADVSGKSFISSEFPAGTTEVFVHQGTLLGYQGNYSGDPGNPVGVHLHFSIVKDDGRGKFKNELEIANTYDPSPFFGLPLNIQDGGTQIITCDAAR